MHRSDGKMNLIKVTSLISDHTFADDKSMISFKSKQGKLKLKFNFSCHLRYLTLFQALETIV